MFCVFQRLVPAQRREPCRAQASPSALLHRHGLFVLDRHNGLMRTADTGVRCFEHREANGSGIAGGCKKLNDQLSPKPSAAVRTHSRLFAPHTRSAIAARVRVVIQNRGNQDGAHADERNKKQRYDANQREQRGAKVAHEVILHSWTGRVRQWNCWRYFSTDREALVAVRAGEVLPRLRNANLAGTVWALRGCHGWTRRRYAEGETWKGKNLPASTVPTTAPLRITVARSGDSRRPMPTI
jgi:hypothetical protein